MSDELFEKFDSLNDETGDTADTVDNAEENAPELSSEFEAEAKAEPETAREPEAYEAPRQTAQPQYPYSNAYGWQSSYQSAQPQQTNPYINSYQAKPVQNPTPSVQYSAPQTSVQSNANSYVDSNGYYHRSFTEHRPAGNNAPQQAPQRAKKEKAKMSAGAVAAILVVCMILSAFAGFGGSYLYSKLNSATSSGGYDSVSNELVIHKVSVENSTESSDTLVDKSTDEITKAVADSVVEITTEVVQTNSFYGQYIAQGAGSGVIISEDGYIITNNHVIEDSSNITVSLRNGDSYTAKLIGTDADEDIALIKIEATGLTTAVFGDSSTLEVGDKSVIIGNPLGTLGGSVTEGIISALDRSIVIDGKTMHLMQTDAAINPGNSGGGMFNGQGELVGIVVAKSGGSTSSGSTIDNIGFVIPINNVLNILGDLKQYGYVRGKADTGMSFVDITNQMYAYYYFNSTNTGVFISSVDRGSNAASAGFSVGDRVISIDGKSVSSASDITSIISEHSSGDTITFEIERSGRTGTLDLTLDEYVPSASSSSPFGAN